MRNALFITLLGAGLLGVPMLAGCDDKTKTTQTEVKTNPNGSTTVDKKTTTTDNNGNTKTSTEHKTVP
jgi:hypothetical protein